MCAAISDYDSGKVPAYYQAIYEACCDSHGTLRASTIDMLATRAGPHAGYLRPAPRTRSELYRALALIAYAQGGHAPPRQIDAEFPVPALGEPQTLRLSWLQQNADTELVSVQLAPERCGLFLKHREYVLECQGIVVRRRYTDFVNLRHTLLEMHPYRMVPALPPKKTVVSGEEEGAFLENRRLLLAQWLHVVRIHPVLRRSSCLAVFLNQPVVLQEGENITSDESTLDTANTASLELAWSREHTELAVAWRALTTAHAALMRAAQSADLRALAAALSDLAAPRPADSGLWSQCKRAFLAAVQQVSGVAVRQEATRCAGERDLGVALAILEAHAALAERMRRGVHRERAHIAHHATQEDGATRTVKAQHAYALRCALEESRLARGQLPRAAAAIAALAHTQRLRHAQMSDMWAEVHHMLSKSLPESPDDR